jgi:hypothetical protein
MGQSAISPACRSFSVLEIFGEAFSNLGKRLAVSNTVAHAGQSLDILGTIQVMVICSFADSLSATSPDRSPPLLDPSPPPLAPPRPHDRDANHLISFGTKGTLDNQIQERGLRNAILHRKAKTA